MFFMDNTLDLDRQFDLRKFVPFVPDFHDFLQSYLIEQISSLTPDGKFTITSEEGDPALISYKIYNDTQFWWLLMLYNDIIGFDELFSGRVLMYPFAEKFSLLYFDLKSKEVLYGLSVEE